MTMEIKITHPIPDKPDLKVGYIYRLPVKEAQTYLVKGWAYEVQNGDRQNTLEV